MLKTFFRQRRNCSN